MKTLPVFAAVLMARLGRALHALQVSFRASALRPAPVLVPIPIRDDRGRRESFQWQRHRGF